MWLRPLLRGRARIERTARAIALVERSVVDIPELAVRVDRVIARPDCSGDDFGRRIRAEDLIAVRVDDGDVFVSGRGNADVVFPFGTVISSVMTSSCFS
jgi:hypothetical protein